MALYAAKPEEGQETSSFVISKPQDKPKSVNPKVTLSNRKPTDYELMIIIKPLLPEDVRLGIQSKLSNLVTSLGGQIKSTDVWGKRHLAYKIQGHSEGYYVVYKCNLLKDQVKRFDELMSLNNDIIRYLLVKEDNL